MRRGLDRIKIKNKEKSRIKGVEMAERQQFFSTHGQTLLFAT